MTDKLIACYKALNSILIKGAYSNIELEKSLRAAAKDDRPFITKIVRGVLEKGIELDYIIKQYVDKQPQKPITIVLKIGVYLLKYTNVPSYAAVNQCVELTKKVGKHQVSGFVNAVLKKISDGSVTYPNEKNAELSIKHSYPLWAVKKLVEQYGQQTAEKIVSQQPDTRAHIRCNNNVITDDKFQALLSQNNISFTKSRLSSCYYVSNSSLQNDKIPKNAYTNQSLGSVLVCLAVQPKHDSVVLDSCAAPGGKSVLLCNQCKSLVALDVHPHRTQLINSYAKRMEVKNIEIKTADASVYVDEYDKKFDRVLCDVPCSGFGVLSSKPDIMYNRSEDLTELNRLQYYILSTCANYVKVGGTLVYSTCTVFKEENQDIINKFLQDNKDFCVDKINLPIMPTINSDNFLQYLPGIDECEGYFIARLKRVSG